MICLRGLKRSMRKKNSVPGWSLREYMNKHNKSNAGLAADLCVNTTTVERWIAGTCPGIAWRLAHILYEGYDPETNVTYVEAC